MQTSFERAQSEVGRMLEDLGGSANAYEQAKTRSAQADVNPFQNPEPLDTSDHPHDDEPETLFGGTGDDSRPVDEALCGGSVEEPRGFSPFPPISERYELVGNVEDMGELSDLFDAFVHASLTKEPGEVKMQTGTYEILCTENGWCLLDGAKGLRYLLDDGEASNMDPDVQLDDTVVWVIRARDDADLGYIHQGWVYHNREAQG